MARELVSESLIEKNKVIYDDFFDLGYVQSLAETVMSLLDKHYFRSKLVGFENLPERNNPDAPLIYCSNHSGMAFPWDAIVFATALYKQSGGNINKCIRALTAPMLSMSDLMCPYMLPDFWKRCGGIDATMLNFETMMRYPDSNVMIYPEGVPGIGKGFNNKYKLQRFSTSFLRMSIKYKTDIIPYSTVNGEYINPYSYNNDSANKLVQKMGMPFLPIGPSTMLVPFQPWMFYFGFPANITYVMGKRFSPYEMINKPLEKIKKRELWELRDHIQKQMQAELDEAVKKHGNRPFEMSSLMKELATNLNKLAYILPSGWPTLFYEHDRIYKEQGSGIAKMDFSNLAYLKGLFKNPSTLAFYIPILGWAYLLGKNKRKF